MQDAEAEEPEEQGVMDNEAVDEAEQDLAIAEKAEGWIGVMLTTDEGEAVEDKHDGRGESVMALQNHSQGEESTCCQGNQKVDTHLAHPAIKGKGQGVSLCLKVRHDGDGGGTNREECEREPNRSPDTGRHWRQRERVVNKGQIETDYRSRHDSSDAGKDADNDDRPAA